MPAWEATYRERLVPAEDALSHVKPGDHVFAAIGQQVGPLIAGLLALPLTPEAPVRLSAHFAMEDISWYSPEIAEMLRINVHFASPASREAVNDFRADYTPWWVWGAHKAWQDGRDGARPPEVSLIRVSPPNKAGFCCIGHILWDARDVARQSPLTIALVNENTPSTFGDTWMHVSEIDFFVEDSTPPRRAAGPLVLPEPDPWDKPIADHVSTLVRDGDTFQIGLGSTTGNLVRLGALDGRNDLGYFAELTVLGVVGLVERGIITGARMNTHPGKFVTTMAGVLPSDVALIHENPTFEFYSTEYMHHPGAIGRNDNMVSLNNALSVDLTGQIAAGQIGPRVWSGTGGQLAYHMGALLSKGGRAVTLLPATALGGSVSRIVAQFPEGQIVTVPRDLADIVVTEYGIAELLNKTQRQRAEALIEIAHPDFRSELRREAKRLLGA